LIGSVGAQFRFPLMGWSGRAPAHQQASLQGALKTRSTPWQKFSRIQSPFVGIGIGKKYRGAANV
jgi:hypothetical protein